MVWTITKARIVISACVKYRTGNKSNKSGVKSEQQNFSHLLESCTYRFRLCHLKLPGQQSADTGSTTSDSNQCYGFTLRSGSGDGYTGQYVGDVDPGSVAERAGLRVGDRIIEVNGFNVETESHREVCICIYSRMIFDSTRLSYFSCRSINLFTKNATSKAMCVEVTR
jgi:C-terminal processing protease CtpA/Prc